MNLVPYGGGALITGIGSGPKQINFSMYAFDIETAAPLLAAFAHGELTKIFITKPWVNDIDSSCVLEDYSSANG